MGIKALDKFGKDYTIKNIVIFLANKHVFTGSMGNGHIL